MQHSDILPNSDADWPLTHTPYKSVLEVPALDDCAEVCDLAELTRTLYVALIEVALTWTISLPSDMSALHYC